MACVLDEPPAVVSMTILTFGMSVTDTWIIRRTAKKSRYVAGLSGIDQSLGYILASICVNVYCGLGLPWLIAVVYVGMSEN